MSGSTSYSNLWLYVHILFKALQGATLVGTLVSGVYYRGDLEKMVSALDYTFRFGFPFVFLVGVINGLTVEEQIPTRAEKLARNWRQLLVDAFTFVGALAGAVIPVLAGSKLFGKVALGAAAGTFLYLLIMNFLPHYDSKDVFRKNPKNPPGLGNGSKVTGAISMWLSAFWSVYANEIGAHI